MPVSTPSIKINAVEARGGEVVLAGESFTEAFEHAVERAQQEGLTFVHPYDDPDVIAGQGTVAMEILRHHHQPIEAIFCAVGGGGLIAGIAASVQSLRPAIKIIAVEAAGAAAMTESLACSDRLNFHL